MLDANDAAVRLLGYRRDELMSIGTGGEAFLADASDAFPIVAEILQRGEWHGEVRLRRKDGEIVPVEANVAQIDLPEGPVFLALWHDISERQARERFEHEFLADIAHDLKNPLTVIRAQTQLLARRLRMGRLDDETAGAGLKEIDTGTARMVRRIDELSDVAQLRLGRSLELRLESTDLVALAEQLAATWRRATEGREIRVEAEIPELIGEWDAVRLERVLDNLLSNAVKYSPQGGPIEIRVSREREPESDWAVLTVRDEGIGVPAADLPWIFERFRRAGNVPGRVAGSGIGLAGAKQIVTQHGGTIVLESEEGRGTKVTVRLPLGVPSLSG
jgi:PAS domain S-box-containing protein